MTIYASVEVSETLLDVLHRQSYLIPLLSSKGLGPNTFQMDELNIYQQMLDALKRAPDSKIHISTTSASSNPKKAGSRNKNIRAINRISELERKDQADWEDWEQDPESSFYPTGAGWSVYDVIRSIADGNGRYQGSFFGTRDKYKGNLFHVYRKVNVPGQPKSRKYDLYIKFIAPAGVLDEKSIYDEFKNKTDSGTPIEITEQEVRPGYQDWEVESFHAMIDD